MSVIAVAAIGVGAAIGAGVVAASIATVATVLTVAAVVGVIGIGLTVVGAVTKNKLLGQIGMVLSMGSLGAVGGAAGAGALGLGAAEAAGSTGAVAATGETVAATAAPTNAGVVAPELVQGGGAVDFAAGATQKAGSGVAINAADRAAVEGARVASQTVAAPAAQAPDAARAAQAAGAPIEPAGVGRVSQGITNTPKVQSYGGSAGDFLSNPPATMVKPGVTDTLSPSGWSRFWDSNAGGAVMAGAPGALIQGVGGMMQGAGASKAAEANYKLQQQQLELQRAQWERGNSAAAVQFRQF